MILVMNLLKLKLTNKKYIIGVSGGADSMALLSMCLKDGIDVVVGHVNYNKRDSAIRDENIVKEYCAKNDISFHVLRPTMDINENFQSWARNVRYSFFKQLYDEYNASGLLLAHHEDDVIETYLMQLERNSKVEYYGINEETTINNMLVIRPLLNKSKEELLEYISTNNVEYGLDESNLTNDYTRNKIRHEVVEKANAIDRENWLNDITIRNEKLHEYNRKLFQVVSWLVVKWSYEIFSSFLLDKQKDILRTYLKQKGIEEANYYTDKYMEHLVSCCISDKNCREQLNDKMLLDQCYKEVYIHENFTGYNYILETPSEMNTEFFQVNLEVGSSVEAVYVTEADFPLTIRSFKSDDAIVMRYGTKKVRRWFIDRKIPTWEREKWPIVVNKEGELILVPQIGCNVEHYNVKPNFFVIK